MRIPLHEINWSDCKVEKQITEGKKGKKKAKYILSGPFMRCGVPSRNNRIFQTEDTKKALEKIRPLVADKRIRMLVDHPMWEGPSLSKTGAILLEVSDIQEDGYVHYKAQVINTTEGKNLMAILDAGGKIGVSTRGYGLSKEEEFPGLDGTFNVIYDYELESIDFVDDPAVLDTEAYMHMESKKRRSEMLKTIEELRAAHPELVQKLLETTTIELNKEFEAKIEEANKAVSTKETEVDALVESIKKVFPDKFVVVEESTIVSEKDAEIEALNAQIKESKEALEALETKIQEEKTQHIVAEKDAHIEHLKATDPEFFQMESFDGCFDSCLNKEEVVGIYEANSKILKEMKTKINTPKPSDVKQTDGNSEAPASSLTEEQQSDFAAKNIQRRRMQLSPMTEAKYLEMFGKK